MWHLKWLRRFVRRNTKPIQHNKAVVWKQRLSVIYMLLAWNAFGLVCYMVYTGRKDWAKYYGYKTEEDELVPPGQQWAKALGIEKAKILRFSGLHKESEYDYQKSDVDKASKGLSDVTLSMEEAR